MPDHQLTVYQQSAGALPVAISELGDRATRAFIDFFTAQIRNPNTRGAYLRNANRFLQWTHARGTPLRSIEPFHVAGYIEELGRTHSTPSVKQHLATLRMLGSFLVVRQVLQANPATDVRGPKHVVKVGKTPVLTGADARALFESISADSPAGVRDRALLGVMVYTFARVTAVCTLDVPNYYQVGRQMMIQLQEKGGRAHDMPMHHTAVKYLDEYIQLMPATKGPLFRTINQTRDGFTENRLNRREALAMVKRRCKAAGLGDRFSNHTFRATGITAYLKNGGLLEHAQYMAGHASATTTKLYDRRKQETTLDEVERIIL